MILWWWFHHTNLQFHCMCSKCVSDKDAWVVVPIRILTRLVVQTCRVYQLSVPPRLPHWSYIMYDKIILRCLLQWHHKWFNSAVWTWPQLTIKKGKRYRETCLNISLVACMWEQCTSFTGLTEMNSVKLSEEIGAFLLLPATAISE